MNEVIKYSLLYHLVMQFCIPRYPNLFHMWGPQLYLVTSSGVDVYIEPAIHVAICPDTSSNSPENSHMAICGSHLSINFTLPFTDFLPASVPYIFRIAAETLGNWGVEGLSRMFHVMQSL